jgi:futalosine hydrolase
MTGPLLLVVTAVQAEAEAVASGVDGARVRVVPVGVGAAAAAAGTARLLAVADAAGTPYRAVVSAGIAGGIPGRAGPEATVVGTRSVAGDLGAQTPDGFLTVDELGFGSGIVPCDAELAAALRAALPHAVAGDILTVATVTGTAERAAWLAGRYPTAVAEAMEGYGVGCAAAGAGVPFVEVRTVSNPVGPRDRPVWRIAEALAALTSAAKALSTLA